MGGSALFDGFIAGGCTPVLREADGGLPNVVEETLNSLSRQFKNCLVVHLLLVVKSFHSLLYFE